MLSRYRYDYVKQQVDGLKYMSSHIRLKKVGQVYRGLCPFHGEKTPSLTVYPKGYKSHNKAPQQFATFYCFGCGAVGDVITFKRLKDGLDDNEEACVSLEREFGLVSDDTEVQKNYLEEQLTHIKNSYGNILNLSEINLICSSICRNYLNWIKEFHNEKYKEELITIDKFYKYFDATLLDRNAIDAMGLIEEVTEKINKRRLSFM